MTIRKRQRRTTKHVVTQEAADAFRRYCELGPEVRACARPCDGYINGGPCACIERNGHYNAIWRAFRWAPWGGVNPLAVNVNGARDDDGPYSDAARMTPAEFDQSVALRRALLDAAGMSE